MHGLPEIEVVRAADTPRRGKSPGIEPIRGVHFFDDPLDPAVRRPVQRAVSLGVV